MRAEIQVADSRQAQSARCRAGSSPPGAVRLQRLQALAADRARPSRRATSSTRSRSSWCRSARAASRCCWRSARPRRRRPSTTRCSTTSRQTRERPRRLHEAAARRPARPGRLFRQGRHASSSIANYGLKDGKVFDFISRTTPTGGKDQTFLGQMLAGAGIGGAVRRQHSRQLLERPRWRSRVDVSRTRKTRGIAPAGFFVRPLTLRISRAPAPPAAAAPRCW